MSFLIPSFLAGVLTVLAPCVLTLLPVILGGTVGEKDPLRPIVITLSLGVSVILFSLLLKGTTLFISVPNSFWTSVSGGIIFTFGLTMLFPSTWSDLSLRLGMHKSDKLLHKSNKHKGLKGAILLGAALGPVFTTCSPTYAVILAIILPASLWLGLLNLFAYALGLSLILLLIAYGGRSVIQHFRFAANPNSWLKKSLGILLVLIGFIVMTGLDKTIETWILDAGYLGPIQIEERIKAYFGQ